MNRQKTMFAPSPFSGHVLGGIARLFRANSRHAVQQTASLLDHLVGELLQMERHVEAERLRGLQVNDELDFARLLDG